MQLWQFGSKIRERQKFDYNFPRRRKVVPVGRGGLSLNVRPLSVIVSATLHYPRCSERRYNEIITKTHESNPRWDTGQQWMCESLLLTPAWVELLKHGMSKALERNNSEARTEVIHCSPAKYHWKKDRIPEDLHEKIQLIRLCNILNLQRVLASLTWMRFWITYDSIPVISFAFKVEDISHNQGSRYSFQVLVLN